MSRVHLESIRTQRLDLVPLTPRLLGADRAQAAHLLGAYVPEEWVTAAPWTQRRLAQLHHDPSLQPWLPRAIVSRIESTMIGHIGFHDRPGAEYLAELSPGGVELGYTVFEDWRRQGYAIEAAEGLMDWARRVHGVTRFVVSISPSNRASLALASRLAFRRIGSHIDEEDGPEDIFERRFAGRR